VATLNDAELAREQTAEYLRGLGAHAISVEELPPPEDERPEPATDGGAIGTVGATRGAGAAAGVDATSRAPAPVRQQRRRREFVVVAWFADEPPEALPERLEVKAGTRTRTVPLQARREERFRAE